jgi:hypothetical protein
MTEKTRLPKSASIGGFKEGRPVFKNPPTAGKENHIDAFNRT